MAKRRLDPPSAERLAKMDAEFRSETQKRPNPATAPIAQVAAETAPLATPAGPGARLDRLDAERLKEAEAKGLLITEIPIDKINTENMIRDRSVIGRAELDELKLSIDVNGLRLPIEVVAEEGGTYALLSGYRRLVAHQELAARYEPDSEKPEEGGNTDFQTIKAIIRTEQDTAAAFVAMVEENEIRENLSHYERGRIAVLAARENAFKSTDDAIKALFFSASKAKRSKIKSFAEIFEAFGDLLSFAEDITERRGLRIVAALRLGAEERLRDALSRIAARNFEDEWQAMEPILEELEAGDQPVKKMGRPKAVEPSGWSGKNTLKLSNGMSLTKGTDSRGYYIRLNGNAVDANTVDAAMEHLRFLFEKP